MNDLIDLVDTSSEDDDEASFSNYYSNNDGGSSNDENENDHDDVQELSSRLVDMALMTKDANFDKQTDEKKKRNRKKRLVNMSSFKDHRRMTDDSDDSVGESELDDGNKNDNTSNDDDTSTGNDTIDDEDDNKYHGSSSTYNHHSSIGKTMKSNNHRHHRLLKSKKALSAHVPKKKSNDVIDLFDTTSEEEEDTEDYESSESEVEEHRRERYGGAKIIHQNKESYEKDMITTTSLCSDVGNDDYINNDEDSRFEEDEKEVMISSDDDEQKISTYIRNNKKSSLEASVSSSPSSTTNWMKITTKRESSYYVLPRSSSSKEENNESSIQYPKIQIPSKLYNKLYEHQRIGVEWIASLHINGVGGILGDDMGLGKTMQTLAGIGGLMVAKTIRNALIICPKSVLLNWEREANDVLIKYCGLNVDIVVLESNIRQDRRERLLWNALNCSSSRPHIIITTYGLVKSNTLHFVGGRRRDDESSLYWDYCILDEGHLIKNSNTQQHKSCSRVCRSARTRRLLLTGTPIQNNMKELWSLFDWASSGRLLGKLQRFQNQFAIPIENGRNKNASEWTLKTAEKATHRLQSIIKPHFLQRMKNDEFAKCLPKKKEYVVWSHLSDAQRRLYESYLTDSGKVSAVLSGETRSPLEAITYLKKLCDHPSLIANAARINSSDLHSGKLDVLCFIVKNFKRTGHRCLIFSPSTKMLDIIEATLSVNCARIDGSTQGRERQRLVDAFNQNGSHYDAMLLSTKAAGVGLNLTSADRAIIYSPSWNPADDSQAVDRCYRIGQTKNVVVYRFITSGTVEERMYEKQVHKDGIRRTITTSQGCATERYFNDEDLRKMFTLAPRGSCQMLEKIERVETSLAKFDGVVGISSHDKVYFRSIINVDCVPPEAPFAGTPLKKKIVTRPALDNLCPNENDLISKISGLSLSSSPSGNSMLLDKSQPKSTNETKVTEGKWDDGLQGTKDFEGQLEMDLDLINQLTSDGKIVDKSQPKTSNKTKDTEGKLDDGLQGAKDFEDQLKMDLDLINQLTSDGKIENSLLLLLQLLDNENLKGTNKLKVHKKIASRAISLLEWHKDLQL